MTDQESAEVPQPGIGPLDDPTATVATQLAAVLVGRLRVVRPLRDDRFDPERGQPFAHAVNVPPEKYGSLQLE